MDSCGTEQGRWRAVADQPLGLPQILETSDSIDPAKIGRAHV